MKKSSINNIVICIGLLICLNFNICSCGNTKNSTQGNFNSSSLIQNNTSKIEKYCEVKFYGVELEPITVKKGGLLSESLIPVINNENFEGWYFDSSYIQRVEFPFLVENDIILYAKFKADKSLFIKARDNTIGDNVEWFEYDYTINATATALSQTLSGLTVGNAKYNKNGQVSFYDVHNNSGILFYDGTKYKILENNELRTIVLDKQGVMTDFSNEYVEKNYKGEFNDFAKAIFTYSENDIIGLEETIEHNKYKLLTKIGASDIIATIGNHLNDPLVKVLIADLPETSVNNNMYISFEGDKLSNYIYQISINVSEVNLVLEYTLSFNNSSEAKEIVVENFDNVSFTQKDIEKKKVEIFNYLETFKNQKSSGYNFSINTGVDYNLSNLEINSTFKGTAYRYIDDDIIYFHNDIEIDSDYKNSDLYKESNIEDCHIKKTKLQNGDVYLIEKKILSDKTYLIDNYKENELDQYYLFNSYYNFEEITFIQENTEDKNLIFQFGISKDSISNLLNWINISLDIDPLEKASSDVKIFGDFSNDSIEINKAIFEMKIVDNVFYSLSISCQGKYKTLFSESRDFDLLDDAIFNFNLSIETIKDGKDFVPYTSVGDAK